MRGAFADQGGLFSYISAEARVPLVCKETLALTSIDVVVGVGVFVLGETILSRLLYDLHFRDEPY